MKRVKLQMRANFLFLFSSQYVSWITIIVVGW